MIRFIRWLLFPVALLYGTIVWLRNRLYDRQLLRSTAFDIPVVVIGNLAVGGTGKSPMTEYILRILPPAMRVTVLSRGYGRKTKGFRTVATTDDATQSGDEPLQIKRKFPQTPVVVCEDRVKAIHQIKENNDAVLLDDAFQHRALRPSFSILLFDYASISKPMLPLPTGSFRDSLYESKRAGIIVITKCPDDIDHAQKMKIIAKFRKYSQAAVYFSSIAYEELVDSQGIAFTKEELTLTSVLLLTGIAKPEPLAAYLLPLVARLEQLNFGDHHQFTSTDLATVQQRFEDLAGTKKIIITTEKDWQRLPPSFLASHPIIIAPIRQQILFNEASSFDRAINNAFLQQRSVNEY